MDMKQLRENAREKMKGFCNLCPVCDGKWCRGEVPGMGGALSGASFAANQKALADLKINLRIIHDSGDPDTRFNFFGMELSTPIIGAPIAGCNFNCGPYDDYEFEEALLLGAAQAGTIGSIGDPGRPEPFTNGCKALNKAGKGIIFAKPHKDIEQVRVRYEEAKQAGAIAFGMDIDGAGIPAMKALGLPVEPKTIAKLKELRAIMPDNPFIVKGVMTPDDALRCAEAGVSAIVVSNHGGRVLDCTAGTADVLPAIKRAIGGEMMILADGGIRSGVDALKMLALGADAVLIGRPICWGAYGGDGAAGVKFIIETYTAQLRQAMLLTGCADPKRIDWKVIYREG